jgi:hypothetical protein
MKNCKIQGGATLWARQTIISKIFYDKPAIWFKIWFYLVSRVNFKEDKRFKRGELFLKYEWICEATKATKNQVDHFIRWAKDNKMLATRKTTRGMILEILKYNEFQTLDNYYYAVKKDTEIGDDKSDTESETENSESKLKNKPKQKAKATQKATTTAKQKRNKSDTILKNGKNGKNDTINLQAEPAGEEAEKLNKEILNIYDIFYTTVNPTINFGNKTTRNACIDLLKKYGHEKVEAMATYVVNNQGKKFFPTITTPYQMKEKLGAVIVYKQREENGGGGIQSL